MSVSAPFHRSKRRFDDYLPRTWSRRCSMMAYGQGPALRTLNDVEVAVVVMIGSALQQDALYEGSRSLRADFPD
jgi:hypothetical protein